jgi:hypothetical protein
MRKTDNLRVQTVGRAKPRTLAARVHTQAAEG